MYMYDDMIKTVEAKFPEMVIARRKQIDEYQKDFGEETPPLNYTYFGSVFDKFVVLELLKESPNEDLLNRMFVFIEDMANSEDGDVKTLVLIQTLESLNAYGYEVYQKALKYMLSETLKLNDDVKEFIDEPKANDKGSLDLLFELEGIE